MADPAPEAAALLGLGRLTGRAGLVLFVTAHLRRDAPVQRLVRELDPPDDGHARAPILTTTLVLLVEHHALGPIWRLGTGEERQTLVVALHHRAGWRRWHRAAKRGQQGKVDPDQLCPLPSVLAR